MHFIPTILLASSAALVVAAPAPVQLGEDDVVLYGNGRYAMIKRSDLEVLEAARKSGVAPPKPGFLDDKLFTVPAKKNDSPAKPLTKRGGDTIIIPNADSRFLGWDTLMSTVVKGAPTDISVGAGYSVSNSISVGVSSQISLVKEFLSATVSTDYSRSWSSSQTQSFTAKVPEGKYGAFVSNAWTNRKSGKVFTGTIGGEGSTSTYQADSFDARGYGNLNWVDGVISLCTGNTFPLKRCLGQGTL